MPIWKQARLTGYHPRDVNSKSDINIEGHNIDMNNQPLRYFEHYKKEDPSSFVGLSADKSSFKYGDKIEIQEYPGVRFVVRDNGGGFNDKTGESAFDMPVLTKSKAREITGTIHWRRVYDSSERTYSNIQSQQKTEISESSFSGFLIVALIGFLMIGKKGIRR